MLINKDKNRYKMDKAKIIFLIAAFILAINILAASAVSIRGVTSNPSEVEPGGTASISISIENIFDYNVYSMDVNLDLSSVPFAPYQSSSEKFLDELDNGDKKTFNFNLIALPSASTGIYKIPVNISYENDAGNRSSKQEIVSITVNSAPKLTLSADSSSILIKGKENSLPVKIINSGLSDVKFLYLSLSDSGGIRILSANEQYLGDISSDDFDTATFSIYVNSNAFSSVNIPVTLKYLDSTNKEFTEVQQITVSTYSLDEAQKLGLVAKPNYFLYAIIPLILVIYLAYRFLKKRRLRKQRS
jgi:hypothetical protein